MKTTLSLVFGLLVTSGLVPAQPLSPAAEATVTVAGKTLTIKYSAPSLRGRKVFDAGGVIQTTEKNYPVWRAGANSATTFHTDADLTIGTLMVPKGDYTLYVNLKDTNAWELVINKQTGQWGLDHDPAQDLGQVKMTMSKPPAPIEQLKYTLSAAGAGKVRLQLEWEQHIAAVTMTLK